MIKINLALRKQPYVGDNAKFRAKNSGPSALSVDTSAITDILKEAKVRQIILLGIVLFAGYSILESTKEEELRKVDVSIAKMSAETTKLKTEVAKTKGYQETKKLLEADELAIRTKIDIIQRLIADRQILPKMMQSVAQIIPADVWLTEFKVSNDEYTFKGFSRGYNQVSDFMRGLNESAFFSEPKLSSSAAAIDETGGEVAQFELGARKRQ